MMPRIRLVLLLVWTLLCAIPGVVLWKLKADRAKWKLIRFYYHIAAHLLRLRVRVVGEMARDRPLLLVTNHCSYLDIIALGAATEVRFTPKSDIEGWPIIGWLSHVVECVFIDRRLSKTEENRKKLHDALARGQVLCLFPEGTTNDGTALKPFRSSYFALAEDEFGGRKVAIQPATIAYRKIYRVPIDHVRLPKIAWYGDMELLPHVMEYLRLGPVEVEICFHPILKQDETIDRKALAHQCQEIIANQLFEQPRHLLSA